MPHGIGPMDGVGSTLKNVVFQKVKSDQAVVYTLEDFANFPKEFVPSIITVCLPEAEEIEEPSNVEQSPLVKDTLSVHELKRFFNKRNECSIKYFKTAADQHPFHYAVVYQNWWTDLLSQSVKRLG